MTRPSARALCGALVLLLPALLARPAGAGPALDALRTHAEELAADTSQPGRVRAAAGRLAVRLARKDEAGAVDDFVKLRAATRAARGALRDDTTYVLLLEDALDEGAATLGGEGTAVAQTLVLLDPGNARDGVATASARAAAARLRYVELRAGGGFRAFAGLRAARSYARCLAHAARVLRKQDARPPRWSVVLEELPGALLGVWADDALSPSVYAVGARGSGARPAFLRLSGDDWVSVPIDADADLWWVTGVPGDGVWACGSGGTVVRYDPATAELVARDVPGETRTLYGVWGAAPDDVWAVGGGSLENGPVAPLAVHWDGTAWTSVELPAATANRTLFKVWGRASDDVWACGGAGVIVHWDGSAWQTVASDTVATLLTIAGTPAAGGTVVAVGGPGVDATITEGGTSAAFERVTLPAGLESLSGVTLDARGDGWAAGVFGTVLRREDGAWSAVADVPTPGRLDHHAVALDAAGGAWFVGGSLTGTLDRGFVVHRGTRRAGSTILPQAKLRTDVAPLLSANCATIGCHLAPFANEGLDLFTPENVRGQTVGVPSTQSSLLRVVPGRPSQSYLWLKLLGTQASVGGSGSRMPSAAQGLDDDELAQVRAWVLEGALDD